VGSSGGLLGGLGWGKTLAIALCSLLAAALAAGVWVHRRGRARRLKAEAEQALAAAASDSSKASPAAFSVPQWMLSQPPPKEVPLAVHHTGWGGRVLIDSPEVL
jgi:hypothetical protein